MRLLMLALTAVFSVCLSADTAPVSNSEKYNRFITDFELKLRFTDGQNQKLARYYKTSPHHKMVSDLLKSIYGGPITRATLPAGDTRQVQWIDRGIGLPSEVSLIDLTGTTPTKLLYSNTDPGTVEVISEVTLSPKADYAVIVLARYGSIDQKQAVIFDLQTKHEIGRLDLFQSSYAWVSPTQINYTRMDDNGDSSNSLYDALTGNEATVTTEVAGQSADLVLLTETVNDETIYSLTHNKTGVRAPITFPKDMMMEINGNDKKRVYFLSEKDKTSTVFVVDWTALAAGSTNPLTPSALITESTMLIDNIFLGEDTIFTHERMLAKRRVRAYWANTGRISGEFEVPDCCSVTGVSWATPGKTLNVNFLSPVTARTQFVYDLPSGTWNKDPATVLTLDGVTYRSEVFYATSADGTAIPSRLIYRSDLTPNGARPVLIKSYGGFNSSGHFDPRFDRAILEFLKRGGMFAGPALRGGNEGGGEWHKAATKENKIKTFEDLDAVAKQLVTNNWTTARKIAIQGTSNGGLTAAATALLFPDDFGLAIPIAGVDDLLGKDLLDSVYGGWSYEYDSAEKGANHLTKISPVENASRQGGVKFLVIDGAQDTRVNPAHSIKLAKALIDQGGSPGNTFLYTVANAGHGAESVTVNGNIGLSVAISIWTMIYDMAEF